MKVLLAACSIVLLAACERRAAVPLNTMLWRLDRPWEEARAGGRPGVRTAPATIVVFRADNEYVEVHCTLIEQPDQSVLIQSDRPCVAAVGRWEKRGNAIEATRESAGGAGRPEALKAIFCSQPRLTFEIEGNSVRGNAGGSGVGSYTPVTRFVAPEFETWVNAGRRSDVRCAVDPE